MKTTTIDKVRTDMKVINNVKYKYINNTVGNRFCSDSNYKVRLFP